MSEQALIYTYTTSTSYKKYVEKWNVLWMNCRFSFMRVCEWRPLGRRTSRRRSCFAGGKKNGQASSRQVNDF